jgi:hypothetical protein
MPPYRCGGSGNQGGAIIPMRIADLQGRTIVAGRARRHR